MAFPSQQKISLTPQKLMDPFSGAKDSVVTPSLPDFLRITELTHYQKKLKKIKCVETEDLMNMTTRVGFLHVEEQRMRRYIDHFQRKVLVQAEQKKQPITLNNFFQITNLQHVEKQIKKYGIVEFDDLPWMAYQDLATMLPKKVELYRFKRYIEKVQNSPEAGITKGEVQIAVGTIKNFLIEAKLKNQKSTFEKLAVLETDDLYCLDRSDLVKLSQMEFERFKRYREKRT